MRGYRQTMYTIWIERDQFDISENRLADQERTIMRNKWLTSEELDEIKRKIIREEIEEIEEEHQMQEEHMLSGSETEEVEERGTVPMGAVIGEPQTNEEKDLVKAITEKKIEITVNRPKLRALRHNKRSKIMAEVKRLDNVVDCVKIDSITEMNDTIMACATLPTEKLC